jgi:anti-anti-sigma factor
VTGDQAGSEQSGVDGPARRAVTGISSIDGAVVVRLAGELDLHDAPEVRDALAGAIGEAPALVVVDLAEVTFVDSTTLGVFVEARKRLDTAPLALAAPGPEVMRALRVTGLDRHFELRGSVQEALGAAR